MTKSSVVIDLGGTHVRAALVAEDGTILTRVREATPVGDPEPTMLLRLMEAVAEGADPTRATVGVPGVVDYDNEALVAAPNLPKSWNPYLSGAWLSQRSGLDVAMANDCDLAAVGEATFGAGRDCRDVVYVTISTGVGAGIVTNHRLMRGRYSGGEVGHSIVDRSRAGSGSGTVEEQGSGTAIMAAAKAAGLSATGAELAELVRSGDETARRVWNDGIEAAAFGVVNLCWMVAPQMVVVGGGVGMNSDIVLPIIADRVKGHGPSLESIAVVAASLADDAALAGGAAWWQAIGRDCP